MPRTTGPSNVVGDGWRELSPHHLSLLQHANAKAQGDTAQSTRSHAAGVLSTHTTTATTHVPARPRIPDFKSTSAPAKPLETLPTPQTGLRKSTYAEKAVAQPKETSLLIGIPQKYRRPKYRGSSKPKPTTLDPSLQTGWKAWLVVDQHAKRPGGQAPTWHEKNPVTDSDKRIAKEALLVPGRDFDALPSALNLHTDENPHFCRGIFYNRIECPFTATPSRCQYQHYIQQSTLDFVVTKRGVNKAVIAWMIENFEARVPLHIQRDIARNEGVKLHVPHDPSAFGELGYGLQQPNLRAKPAAVRGAESGSWRPHVEQDGRAAHEKRAVDAEKAGGDVLHLNEVYKNQTDNKITATYPDSSPESSGQPTASTASGEATSAPSQSSSTQAQAQLQPTQARAPTRTWAQWPHLLGPSRAESGSEKPDRSYLEE